MTNPPGAGAAPVRRRVLLVDDNRDVVRAFARLVRALGHDVEVTFSGDEALVAAERFRPHVVLMDIGLPGLDGCQTATAMRSTPWGGAVTLIALSGWARDADRRRALDAGFDRHYTKPIEPDVLEALLREAEGRGRG
jgi:CheY-like chemotaxis protein